MFAFMILPQIIKSTKDGVETLKWEDFQQTGCLRFFVFVTSEKKILKKFTKEQCSIIINSLNEGLEFLS